MAIGTGRQGGRFFVLPRLVHLSVGPASPLLNWEERRPGGEERSIESKPLLLSRSPRLPIKKSSTKSDRSKPSRSLGLVLLLALVTGCRTTYPAPEGRSYPTLSATQWGATDSGDTASIRRAEQACLSGLSPRAISAAFQAVDEAAAALVDLCSIGIVDDDPLVWHVWCGSDALFTSGHYLAPANASVRCEGENARTAFECIGRILARHLLGRSMSQHVQGVEIVAIGSVDRQRLARQGEFLSDPCRDLQRELRLSDALQWSAPERPPSEEERSGVWNQRLSWCRAAFSGRELQRGMSRDLAGRYELAAIGAGTDWLEQWNRTHRTPCPTSARASGERERGQCRDARRVDLFIRVLAEQGTQAAETCRAPTDIPGGESGQALYCLADCQARAAIGRNPQGYQAPRSAADLLFGQSRSEAPRGWLVDRSANGAPVNTASVRQLLFRDQ